MKRDRRRPLAALRAVLVVVGLLALAAAVAGGLLAAGAVGGLTSYTEADGPLLTDRARSLLTDHAGAFQAGAAAVAGVVVGVGLVWLSLQVPPRRQHDDVDLDLAPVVPAEEPDPAPTAALAPAPVAGYTRVAGAALVGALEDDLVARGPGLHGARADYRHHGGGGQPGELRLRLDVDPTCPVAELMAGPVAAAVDRFVVVAGLAPRPRVLAEVRLAPPDRPRVA